MVKYHLVENFLLGHTNNFIARVKGGRTFDRDALIERMLQCGTTATQYNGHYDLKYARTIEFKHYLTVGGATI